MSGDITPFWCAPRRATRHGGGKQPYKSKRVRDSDMNNPAYSQAHHIIRLDTFTLNYQPLGGMMAEYQLGPGFVPSLPGIMSGEKSICLPTYDGFAEHLIRLHPLLSTTNRFLVDRITPQQIARYNFLATMKTDSHFRVQPRIRSLDELELQLILPPSSILPAKLQCDICLETVTLFDPCDWSAHVFADLQAFTCTWPECRHREPFKNKRDWVRHENERHRHLEWWACDVSKCNFMSFRKDDFIQHLVHEHKLLGLTSPDTGEPDSMWRMVDQGRQKTKLTSESEPCRFCGQTSPSWEALTAHTSSHMEQISLSVIWFMSSLKERAARRMMGVWEPKVPADEMTWRVDDSPVVPNDSDHKIPFEFYYPSHLDMISEPESWPFKCRANGDEKPSVPVLSQHILVAADIAPVPPVMASDDDASPSRENKNITPASSKNNTEKPADRALEGLRQVGMARIRIEGVSLVPQVTPVDIIKDAIENGSDGMSSVSDDEYDSDGLLCDGAAGSGDTGSSRETSAPSVALDPCITTSKTARQPKRGRNGDQRGSDGDENNRKRRKRSGPSIPDDGPHTQAQTLPRFACPYQAFEGTLDCLSRGKGCETISRLK